MMNNADLIYGTGKYTRKPMDFYPTPTEVTHALTSLLEEHSLIHTGDLIWEPACGNGDMSEVFIKRGYNVFSTDIRDTEYASTHNGGGKNFLDESVWVPDAKWIITNPPFNVSEGFIQKCLTHHIPFAFLLKSQYWHSARRYSLFYKRKPMFVCPLTWRPAFEGKGKSSLMDFVWTVWGAENVDTKYIPLSKK